MDFRKQTVVDREGKRVTVSTREEYDAAVGGAQPAEKPPKKPNAEKPTEKPTREKGPAEVAE